MIFKLVEPYFIEKTICTESFKSNSPVSIGVVGEEAIDLIREKDDDILDKLGAKEALGRMFLASGRNQEAEELYRGLIDKNPENTRYHDGLFRSLGLPALVKGAASSQLPKMPDRRWPPSTTRCDTNTPNASPSSAG